MDVLATIMVVLGMIAALGSVPAVGYWILGPIDRAARYRRHRVQFTMADFLSLVFLLQLPMGAIHALEPPDGFSAAMFNVLGMGICGVIWWTSVRSLSQAGIRKVWHRSLFLTLVLPLAFVGSVVSVLLTTVLLGGIYEALTTRARLPIFFLLLAVEIGLLAAFYVAGRFTRRMAAEADRNTDSWPAPAGAPGQAW